MSGWAFRNRRDAVNAKHLTRQNPPRQMIGQPVDFAAQLLPNGNYIAVTPASGIPAISGDTPGKAMCAVEYIDENEALVESLKTDFNNNDPGVLEIPVYNLSTDKVPGQIRILIWQIGDKWVFGQVLPPPFGARPWMRFVTNEKIVDREVEGVIDIVTGAVINPLTSQPYKPGDTVTLSDPTNMWGEIEADATGTAYYRSAADPQSPNPDEDRWEIEDCSLPINRIRGRLLACLKSSDLTGDVVFGSAAVEPVADWILSGYNNCDFPPEINVASDEDYVIQGCENNFALDAIKGAFVTLRRLTDVEESDPKNLTVPKARSATTAVWEIEDRWEQIARWALFEWTGGTPILQSFWEGADPTICGPPTLVNRLPNCLKTGDNVLACYDPEADTYVSVSAFVIGEHDPVTSLNFANDAGVCKLTWTSHCGAGGSATLPTVTVSSFERLEVFGSEICAVWTNVQVVGCSDFGSTDLSCVDICPILCLCPELIAVPEICDPPPKICTCCDCYFVLGPISLSLTFDGENVSTSEFQSSSSDGCRWLAIFPAATCGESCSWQWTESVPPGTPLWVPVAFGDDCDGSICECPGPPGFDGTSIGQIEAVPCEPASTEPQSMTVSYECSGQWTVEGPWPGNNNQGTFMSYRGPGDCGGSAMLADPGNTPSSGSITTDGGGDIECEDPPPCENCSELDCEDREIQIHNLAGEHAGLVAYSQDGLSRSTADCMWEVPIDIEDQIALSNSPGVATVSYSGGTWTVTIDEVVNNISLSWSKDNEACDSPLVACDEINVCDCQPGNGGTGTLCQAQMNISAEPCTGQSAGAAFLAPESMKRDAIDTVAIKTQRVQRLIEKIPKTAKSEHLGLLFARTNPELFKGCSSCKDRIYGTIKRWKRYPPSASEIKSTAQTIKAKTTKPGVTVEEVEALLIDFLSVNEIEVRP